MMYRLATLLRKVIVVVLLILILLPILLGIMILLWIVDVPRKVGQRLNFEDIVRRILYAVVDPDEMRRIRDDLLHILEGEVEIEDESDRWGLLREIDTSQREIEQRLKNGEFAFSFIGSLAALVAGNLLGIVFGGILLTLVGLLFSLLVTARIILTDILCYRSIPHRHDSLNRLALLKAWNRGPIFGYGAVGIALLSAIASRKGIGYQLGRGIVEGFTKMMYGGHDKWRAG